MGSFKGRNIGKGQHESLHQIIHRLSSERISYDKIEIPQNYFNGSGYKVDVLAELANQKYIVVELGQLSCIGKFDLIYHPKVQELWLADKEKFVYGLSLNEPRNDSYSEKTHFHNYYQQHCCDGQLSECLSPHYAYNCMSIRRLVGELQVP